MGEQLATAEASGGAPELAVRIAQHADNRWPAP